MAITLATGTIAAIATTYAAAKTFTTISNAAEAVAAFASGHDFQVGDYLEVTSGWDRLNGRIVRVKTVQTDNITFESINTTSTTNYPAGTGAGTAREITAWTNLSQVTSGISVSGGDINFADVTTIVDTVQKQIPTTRSAVAVKLPLYDDPSLSWYASVVSAADSATATGFRMSFPNGSKLVANSYWSIQTVPTIEDSTLRSSIDVAFAAPPVRYAT